MPEVLVEIGGWTVSIILTEPGSRLEPAYRQFLSSSYRKPNAEWKVEPEPIPSELDSAPPSPPPFPLWEIERGERRTAFRLWKRMGSAELWKAARTDTGLSRGKIWTDRSSDSLAYPLRGLDQLLFAHFFLHRGGLIVHAAAAEISGRGYLFPAPAGGGKSTWAKLLGGVPGVNVLAEDKIVLRREGNNLRIFGTPWNPNPESRVAGSAALEGIFFLSHHPENSLQPLEPAETLRQLLQQSFLPFSALELEEALSILEDVTGAMVSSGFGFRPDRSAIEYFLTAIA